MLFTAIELSLGGSSPYTSTDNTIKNRYTKNETIQNTVQTIQKYNKYKYTYYQNTHIVQNRTCTHPHITKHTHTHTHTLRNTHTPTHTLQSPHIHTPTNYKTHTYTHPHITKPTHTHTHILQNPHIHTPTYYKIHTYTHPRITKQVKTTTVQDTHQIK